MAEYKYQDILIENGDVVLDAGRNPILIQDRAVIAQDIKQIGRASCRERVLDGV